MRIGDFEPMTGRKKEESCLIGTAPRKWRIRQGAPEFAGARGKTELTQLARKECADSRLFELSRALSRINGGDPDQGRARGTAISAKEARHAR